VRVGDEVAEAESSGSTKPRRGEVRAHPALQEMLIVLSSFFTIDLSIVDFCACGSRPALVDLIAEFGQLPVPAPIGSLSFHFGDRKICPLFPEF
jgi:hypothetical protein